MNLDQLYEQTIKSLSAADRLRLATLILNNIPPDLIIDDSEEWTEEDYRDFNGASWTNIDARLREEESA